MCIDRSVMYVTPGRKVPRKVVVEPRPTSTPPNKKARVDEGGESSADTRTSAHKSQRCRVRCVFDVMSMVVVDKVKALVLSRYQKVCGEIWPVVVTSF